MHHVVLDHWSRRKSLLHARDARAKILAALAFLVCVATTAMPSPLPGVAYGCLLLAGLLLSRLPLLGLLLRAAVVLPFTATFAAMTLLAGDPGRAFELLQKSYLSATAVLLLAATTPLPELLRGLEALGAPRFVLLVIQFLYRYLFVISEQAQHMRLAAMCRGSESRPSSLRRSWLAAAAGAIAVLFGRSYARAEAIHTAMLARGYRGHVPLLSAPTFRLADGAFLLLGILAPVTLSFALGGPS